MKKRIAIIPARANSKRLKSKNIKLFYGKPLIHYSLKAAKECNLFDKIHVSTESKNVKKIVQEMGFKVDFLRDKKLSKDKTSVEKVIKFVIDEYLKRGEIFDEIFLIFATNPFVSADNLKKAYKKYCLYKKKFSIMPVVKFNKPLEWALIKNNKKKVLKPKFPKGIKKTSKDFSELYYEAGMFIIYQKNYLYKKINLSYKAFELKYHRTVDIDNLQDFKIAQSLYKLK